MGLGVGGVGGCGGCGGIFDGWDKLTSPASPHTCSTYGGSTALHWSIEAERKPGAGRGGRGEI